MSRSRWINLAILVMIVAIGIGPVSSWLLRNEIRRSIGFAVKIDSLTIKRSNEVWLAPRLTLSTTSELPGSAIKSERAWFDLSWQKLLSRRFDFSKVILENAIIPTPPDRLPQIEFFESDSTQPAILSTLALEQPIDTYWDDLLKNLRVEETSKKLASNWGNELSSAEQKVLGIEQSIAKMRSHTQSLDNPLRDIQELRESTRQAKQIRESLPKLEKEINEFAQSRLDDKWLLEEAISQDTDMIVQQTGDFSDQCQTLSNNFVKQLISQQLSSLRKFGEVGATAVSLADFTNAQTSRGRDLFTSRSQSIPSWQVERAIILGHVSIDGQLLPVEGRLDHLVSSKAITARPTTAQFKINREGRDIIVQASRLKTMTHPMESIDIKVVDVPNISWDAALPQLQLKGVGGLLSTVINWERDEEKWKCAVQFQNKGVFLSVSAPDSPMTQGLIDRMNDSLTGTFNIEITGTIFVDGLGKSSSELKSNLAQALEQAFESSVTEQAVLRRTSLLEKYDSQFEQKFEALAQSALEQDKLVLDRIKKLHQDIDKFHTEVAARIDPRNDNRYSRTPTPNRVVR
jgi:hypothetical protein